MAQAITANLLAGAQATTFECRLAGNPLTQVPRVSVRRSMPCMMARAPCISRRRAAGLGLLFVAPGICPGFQHLVEVRLVQAFSNF